MTVSTFESIRNSLLPAQDRCISKLDELIFKTQPTWDDIKQGICLIDEFKLLHFDALSMFAAHPQLFPSDSMAEMLERSQAILTESLLILEGIMLRNYSRS